MQVEREMKAYERGQKRHIVAGPGRFRAQGGQNFARKVFFNQAQVYGRLIQRQHCSYVCES